MDIDPAVVAAQRTGHAQKRPRLFSMALRIDTRVWFPIAVHDHQERVRWRGLRENRRAEEVIK